jgi:hypothetical protein
MWIATAWKYMEIKFKKCHQSITSKNTENEVFTYLFHATVSYNKRTPWPESASELYRLSGRSLTAKLVSTMRIQGVVWTARLIPKAVFSIF